jgi:hypothetical protein
MNSSKFVSKGMSIIEQCHAEYNRYVELRQGPKDEYYEIMKNQDDWFQVIHELLLKNAKKGIYQVFYKTGFTGTKLEKFIKILENDENFRGFKFENFGKNGVDPPDTLSIFWNPHRG